MRFVVSHQIAGKTRDAREEARATLSAAEPRIAAFADVRNRREASARNTLIVEGDAQEFVARATDLPADIIVEPEVRRSPAVQAPFSRRPAGGAGAGAGAAIDFRLTSAGAPLANARVSLTLQNLYDGSAASVGAVTDAAGLASAPFDPRLWTPIVAAIVPASDAWPWLQPCTSALLAVDLPPLPRAGPLAWWHQSLGVQQYSAARGQGIRVGVADTGAGPHPDLAHITRVGAFLLGSHDAAADLTADIEQHGTHICGIIGARPGAARGSFAGIAPGAELIAARVYAESPDGSATASNADIANALDELSDVHECDIINLSLGGDDPSQIEADALLSALERGSLVLCAAGNRIGAVTYPAAYPGAVAISAVGLIGTAPQGALDWTTLPPQYDRYAAAGYYLADFSDLVPQLACTAPGVGIVSTVPGARPAYAAMNGTSMSTAVVSGALAALLSQDAAYRKLGRDIDRARHAWAVLVHQLRSLGLASVYQGYGMPMVTP